MSKIPTENLFLLEFLVDSLNLNNCTLATAPPGEKCVSFQFLDNGPLEVCEEDFDPKRKYGVDNDTTKNGKSCLFSLTPELAEEVSNQFDVIVSVFARMDPECEDENIELGTTIIPIQDLFNDLVESIDQETGVCPTAKTLKDEFELLNQRQRSAGKITVYIRLSCFGKLIITQFQMNMDDKSVLFKDREGKSLYRYKKAGGGTNADGPTNGVNKKCTPRTPGMGFGNPPYGPPGMMPGMSPPGMMPNMGPPPMMPNMGPPVLLGGMPPAPGMQGFGGPVGMGGSGGPPPMGGGSNFMETPCLECGGMVRAPCATGDMGGSGNPGKLFGNPFN